MDFKVPDDLSAGHLCLQDCWECVGSSISIHACSHGAEVPAWERDVKQWSIIPSTTPDLALAKRAQFSSLACVLPPLPAKPLCDASDTRPWLSLWLFQQVPPVAPSHSIRSCILDPQGEVRVALQGLGAPTAAPQLRVWERLHFNPIPLLQHPGILLPTELPLFTQLRGIDLQGSQIPFSPFPSENTS